MSGNGAGADYISLKPTSSSSSSTYSSSEHYKKKKRKRDHEQPPRGSDSPQHKKSHKSGGAGASSSSSSSRIMDPKLKPRLRDYLEKNKHKVTKRKVTNKIIEIDISALHFSKWRLVDFQILLASL